MEHKITTETILGLAETSKEAKEILKLQYPLLFLESGYYYINGTMKVLYWTGEEWQNAMKDKQKMYCFVSPLEKQPINIKSVERYRSMFD